MTACRIDLGIPVDTSVTVSQAIDEFEGHKRRTEAWGKRTFERTGADLRFFAREAPSSPMKLVNVQWVRSFLRRMSNEDHALAYQRSRYHAVSEFLAWATRIGLLRRNPSDAIHPSEKPWVGKRARRKVGRGKPQLRSAMEADAYLAACTTLRSAEDRVAAALPLLTGLRSGAIRHLRVGDIDFEASLIWSRDVDDDERVEWDVKTASSRVTVELPSNLRNDLVALCGDRPPTEFVFPSTRSQGGPYERKWLNRLVHDACKIAGTRNVCAHGLRDTYTSILRALAGRSDADIARLVGHDDDGQTARRHYIGAPEHRPALRLPTADLAPQPSDKAKPPTED